jgi:dephospho-CoA kinase
VRDIDEDAWANLLVRDLDPHLPPVAVDDLRFPNEYWALRGAGFRIIRIEAPRDIRIDRLRRNGKLSDDPEWENHISETALADFEADYVVFNTEDVTFLEEQLSTILRREAQ